VPGRNRQTLLDMGIRLPSGATVVFTNALQQRPKLAALIGEVVAEWALAESAMAQVVGFLLGTDMSISTGILDDMPVPKKVSRIGAIAERKIKDDEPYVGRLKAALDDLKAAGKRRDCITHARWAICSNGYPNELLWQRKSSPDHGYEVYDEKKLRSVVTQIAESQDALLRVFRDLPIAKLQGYVSVKF
jgi:hypothetical protein